MMDVIETLMTKILIYNIDYQCFTYYIFNTYNKNVYDNCVKKINN